MNRALLSLHGARVTSKYAYSPFNIEKIEQIQLHSLLNESGDQGWWILQVLCENIQEAFQLGTIAHYPH